MKKPWHDNAKKLVEDMLGYIGENPQRNGLKGTPERVVRSWEELYSGYEWRKHDIQKMLTVFESDGYDEMVVLRGIEFQSTCEHHLLPFYGTAHVGYIPTDGRIVGISKLSRLVDIYSKRLQVQERISKQVTDALMEHLKPAGVGCILVAKHSCMICRGVKKQSSEMITSSLMGSFREDAKVRSEFLSLIGV